MEYVNIINTMVKLFALMILGFVLYKKEFFDSKFNAKVSEFIVNFTAPALIIYTVCGSAAGDKQDVIKLIVIGVILYILLPVLAWIITKLLRVKKEDEGIYQMMIIFSNVAYMSYPIVQALYGDTAIFYNSLLHMGFNFLMFSYGIYLVTKGSKQEKISLKTLINPGLVASVIALIIYFTGIKVPGFISETCGFLGNITMPLSMIVLGSVLAGYSIKDMFAEKRIYIISIIKLIVFPIIAFYIARILFTDPVIIGMTTISMGMPTASMVVMMSVKYNKNVKIASVSVFVTTVLSIITIPLIYILFLVN